MNIKYYFAGYINIKKQVLCNILVCKDVLFITSLFPNEFSARIKDQAEIRLPLRQFHHAARFLWSIHTFP